MRIAIVEDDINWRKKIEEEISFYLKATDEEMDIYSCGEQYLESRKQYDISFIDIEMQGIDGFETISKAREYNPDCFYIILTTHLEMSRKGYIVNAFRYIDKAKLEELEEAIEAVRFLQEQKKNIKVSITGEGLRELQLKDIIYFEAEKHYTLIHTKQSIIKCNNSMVDIETLLPDEWFYRCHKAYIINLDEISHIDHNIAYLSNGKDVDISRRKYIQFKKLYFERQYKRINK